MADAGVTDAPSEIALALRSAMRRMPGAVSLVTTHDPLDDKPAGLAASAVIPVTMAPPSMLVAVNRTASAHASIERAGRFCVNLLGTAQTALVALFSNSELRPRRFSSGDWAFADGLPYLPAACAAIFCTVSKTLIVGTHELFIGTVGEVRIGENGCTGDPLGWIEGNFATLGPLG